MQHPSHNTKFSSSYSPAFNRVVVGSSPIMSIFFLTIQTMDGPTIPFFFWFQADRCKTTPHTSRNYGVISQSQKSLCLQLHYVTLGCRTIATMVATTATLVATRTHCFPYDHRHRRSPESVALFLATADVTRQKNKEAHNNVTNTSLT